MNIDDTRLALGRIQKTFGLNASQMSKLFGVSQRTLRLWQTNGVPPAYQSKLTTMLAIINLLSDKLKTERLARIVCKQSATFDGNSILKMIELDKHEETLKEIRRSFDWSTTA